MEEEGEDTRLGVRPLLLVALAQLVQSGSCRNLETAQSAQFLRQGPGWSQSRYLVSDLLGKAKPLALSSKKMNC